ncbi:hypothetical protein PQQ87_07340 [Paraburkholderia nemoris]|uniref:hypothetical protein n=1 Tax=Paraburkholderia nemoris TaxID=2793076 RepID=UPI0038BDC177
MKRTTTADARDNSRRDNASRKPSRVMCFVGCHRTSRRSAPDKSQGAAMFADEQIKK